MIVQAFGTRGSEPVSSQFKVKYGGNTTCWEVRSSRLSDDSRLLIDMGTGLRSFTERQPELSEIHFLNVLFTHYHSDHRIGIACNPMKHMKSVKKFLFGPNDDGFTPMKAIEEEFSKPRFPVISEMVKSSFKEILAGEESILSTAHVLCFHGRYRTTIPHSEYEELLESQRAQVAFRDKNQGPEFNVNIDEVLFVRNMEVSHPDKCVSYRFEEYTTSMNGPELTSCFVLMTDCEAQIALPGYYKNFINDAGLIAIDCQYSTKSYENSAGYGHGNPPLGRRNRGPHKHRTNWHRPPRPRQ